MHAKKGLEGYSFFFFPTTADRHELSSQAPSLISNLSSFLLLHGSRSAHSEQKEGSGIWLWQRISTLNTVFHCQVAGKQEFKAEFP